MRTALRPLATLLLGVSVATCSDAPNAPVKSAAGKSRFALAPKFTPRATAVYAQRSMFAAVMFDHVRIQLVRPPNEVVKDTTITFDPNMPPKTIDLTIDAKSVGEVFDGTIDYTNNGQVVFRGTAKLHSYAPDESAPAQEVTVDYVGVGANAARVTVTPGTVTLTAPASMTFGVQVFDSAGRPIADVPVVWSSSDASVASVAANGAVQTLAKRGTATITASTLTKVSGSATLNVTLPPTGIVLISGGGQTGKAGATLAASGVVRVVASDGVGVPGMVVNFAGPSGGGVGSPSATTDASGNASSSLRLGGVLGPQSFAASALGFSVSIPATAIAGDPASVVIVSGDKQQDSVKRALKPFVVKVSDSFGNPVANATVTWARTTGAGTLSATSTQTASDGTTSVGYTLGSTIGKETIVASVSGVANGATFTADAFAATPSAITIVSGGGQGGRVAQPLGAPFVVKVTDALGNAAANATVVWTATNGAIAPSTTTDAQGLASNTLTLGSLVGTATVTATIANGTSVTFTASVQVGTVSRIAFKVSPTGGAAGTMFAPVLLELQDAGGNVVPATNAVSIALGANPGNSTLTGTLTRNAVGGVATFDDLIVNRPGNGYTLIASSAGVSSQTSIAFNVTTGAAGNLVFTSQPSTTTAGASIAPGIVVQIRDQSGNTVPTATNAVTLTITNGTGVAGAVIIGTATANAVAGVATFNSIAIDKASAGYTLTAAASGIASAVSSAFTVNPGAPTAYAVQATPSSQVAGGQVSVTAQLIDAYSNTVPQSGRTVNWTSTNGGAFASASQTTGANGATPAQLFTTNTTAGVIHAISATDGATPSIIGTTTVNTLTGPANNLGIATPPSGAAQSGIAFAAQPVIQLRDANNNGVPQAGVTVTASLASGSGTLNGTATAVTNAAGQATFTNLRINGVVGAFTVAFNAPSLIGATSTAIALSPGTPSVLAFVQQPTSAVAGSSIAPVPTVSIRDADGNQTTATTALTVAISAGTGAPGAVLSGSTTVAAVSGLATFTGLSINLAATGYRFTATGTALTAATSGLFNITAGPAASFTIFSGNNQYFPSNWSVTTALQQVIVRDALTNAVPNVPVTFAAGSGATVNNAASTVVNTNASGIAGVSTGVTATSGVATVSANAASLPALTLTATRVNQGPWHTACARTTTNAAYCWGDNQFGTVGNGTQTFASAPSAVAGGLLFPIMAEGFGGHQCGLTTAGTAYCWGHNNFGQLGDNSQSDRSAPVQVAGGLTFTAIATSSYTTCGLTTSQMYCWGWTGSAAVLGDGDAGTIRLVPTLVNTGGRVFTRVTLAEDYACGVEASGVTSCWGSAPAGTIAVATPVPGAPAFTSISSGFYQTCGLTAAGAAFCMGTSNGFGQIGNGSTNPVSSPVQVGIGLTFAEIRGHAYNTCARTTSNVLYCWGDNGTLIGGKVGDGTTTDRTSPTLVAGGIPVAKLLGGGIVQSCAQATSGQPFCWGANGYLGDTITTNNLVPSPARWVQGTAGVATSILIETGNNGTATAGTPVAARPTVIVRDFANNPVANATVTFTVTGGGGTSTGGTVQTNAFGQAIVGSWTLGATPGVNTMTATIVGVGTVIFTATGT